MMNQNNLYDIIAIGLIEPKF